MEAPVDGAAPKRPPADEAGAADPKVHRRRSKPRESSQTIHRSTTPQARRRISHHSSFPVKPQARRRTIHRQRSTLAARTQTDLHRCSPPRTAPNNPPPVVAGVDASAAPNNPPLVVAGVDADAAPNNPPPVAGADVGAAPNKPPLVVAGVAGAGALPNTSRRSRPTPPEPHRTNHRSSLPEWLARARYRTSRRSRSTPPGPHRTNHRSSLPEWLARALPTSRRSRSPPPGPHRTSRRSRSTLAPLPTPRLARARSRRINLHHRSPGSTR